MDLVIYPGLSISLSSMIKREGQLGPNTRKRVDFLQFLKGLNILVPLCNQNLNKHSKSLITNNFFYTAGEGG